MLRLVCKALDAENFVTKALIVVRLDDESQLALVPLVVNDPLQLALVVCLGNVVDDLLLWS